MHHNQIIAAEAVIKNLRASGQNSRAEYVEELMNECLRLRQGLWDVAKVCGADTDGNETPAPLISDIVEFTRAAAVDLRDSYEEALDTVLKVSDPADPIGGAVRCEKIGRTSDLIDERKQDDYDDAEGNVAWENLK